MIPLRTRLPPCPRSAVEILDFLHDVFTAFEAHYGAQIHRYYDERSHHNLIKPDRNLTADDPPF